MNFDCLEHVLRCCDHDSLVAVSQTCKTLKQIATGLFHKCNPKYYKWVNTEQDESVVKRTIDCVGNYLTGLHLSAIEYICKFYIRILPKCPNLRELNINGQFLPNDMWSSISTLTQLESLQVLGKVFGYYDDDVIDAEAVIGMARKLKQLQFLLVYGVEWNFVHVIDFVNEARNLTEFTCHLREHQFEAKTDFLEGLRESEDQLDFLVTEYIRRVRQ